MPGEWPYTVSLEHPLSVFKQIENHVLFAIASGYIKPGDALPSVRDLAHALAVNPNTVTKSYRELEILGLLRTRRGVGYTVAQNAPASCCDTTQSMAAGNLACAVSECLAAGLSPQAIRDAVAGALKGGKFPYAPDG